MALNRIIFNYELAKLDKKTNKIMNEAFEKDISILKELVNRNEVCKIVNVYDVHYGKCEKCGNTCHDSMNFCPKCGQRLGWDN